MTKKPNLTALWTKAQTLGRPNLFTSASGGISAVIMRGVGAAGQLSTSFATYETAEEAMRHAIAEAEQWELDKHELERV